MSGYAFYDGGALARAVLINLRAYTSSAGERGSVNVVLKFDDIDMTTKMTIKRLNIPYVYGRDSSVPRSSLTLSADWPTPRLVLHGEDRHTRRRMGVFRAISV